VVLEVEEEPTVTPVAVAVVVATLVVVVVIIVALPEVAAGVVPTTMEPTKSTQVE
jgi:hypothetical protein